MSAAVPPWLAEFQERFGRMLRTPLARETGTLRARPSDYDAILRAEARPGPRAGSEERLAVYNRQYWFRLFELLQSAFPLTCRLLGHWTFNDYAARFLLARPPRSFGIDRVPDGFAEFFAEVVEPHGVRIGPKRFVERAALVEAARIDEAWRTVFFAPEVPRYLPGPEDVALLVQGRLRPSPAAALVEEHWPLLELRRQCVGASGEEPIALPGKLGRSQWWVLVRRPAGIGQLALEAPEAKLFLLLLEHPVGEALARLEAGCDVVERDELPEKTRAWLARSLELDLWSGLNPSTRLSS